MQFVLDLGTHPLGPWLSAEQAVFEGQCIDINPHLNHGIGKKQGITRGADKGGGHEVLHDPDLAFGIAA